MSDPGRQRRHAKDVDCKAELRRFKNREAARRVRERKSNQLNTLQGQVDELKRENQKLLVVIQQLKSTSLAPSSSNGASLGLFLAPATAAAAAAPSVSARPADSMDSDPSAAQEHSPTIRSGQFADRTLPRLHAIIEPSDSCPVVGLGLGDACVMSQPGNALQEKSGALLSSTTLLAATMSAPVLAQQSSLSLRPDEVALQRTCGCRGDQECDECEGVRVTMCSNSSLPLITTPGPKPKPLTLEDLNLPVTVLETSELSPGTSGAAAAAGTSSRAVSSGKRQLPKAQDSFNSRETKRSTMSGQHLQQQQQSASALVRQGSNQIYFQQQQSRAVSAGGNVLGSTYSQQQQQICSNNNSQASQVQQQQQQAAAAMDLDLVETLEPTKPMSAVGQIDDGSSSGNAAVAAAAAAAGGQVKVYGGVCYMRKGSSNSTTTAGPTMQQQQQHDEQQVPRREGEADFAAVTPAAAVVGPEDFTGPASNSYIKNNTDQLATIAEGTDLIGAAGSEQYEDRAAAAAAAAAAVAAAAASARSGDYGSSSGNVQYGQACGASGKNAAAATTDSMLLDQHLAPAAAAAAAADDMGTMQFIPMLPGPIITNQVSDHPAAAAAHGGSSSGKHHKGPKFLRNLAAAVGGLVRPSKSAASTPRSAADGSGVARQFGRGSMSFTAAAHAPAAAAAVTAAGVGNGGIGGNSSGARNLRRASETDAALATALLGQQHQLQQQQRRHDGFGQMNGQIADMAINSPAAAVQQQQLQLLNELMGYQEAVSSGGAAAAAISAEQHQELLLLQQQQQEILRHQRLLRQQLQQQRQQQQQGAAFHGTSGLSMPNLDLWQQQQQQHGSSSGPMPAPAHMWSSLSASAAPPSSLSGSSSSLPAAAAAAARQMQLQQQQLQQQGAWVLRQQQGLAQAAAAAAGLSNFLDDASEEDAVMQLALQEGVLLSGL